MNRWFYFLTNTKDTDQDALLSQLVDPDFKEAVNVMKGYTTEQKLHHAYDMRQNYKRLVNTYIYTGYKQGKDEGREERNLEIARRMCDQGKSDEEIMEITGLRPEDVGNWKIRSPVSSEKLEILCTFGTTLEAESKDLEPKVRTVVQSNFWDLV